ncbi:MAG: hypothetical protein WBQ25_04270 [Nitrososphaeraceae archaeon]
MIMILCNKAAIANDQIMKLKGIGIAADINHSIAEIRKPCAYPLANLLADTDGRFFGRHQKAARRLSESKADVFGPGRQSIPPA